RNAEWSGGVLVKVLRVGVDGTDKEINAAEYGLKGIFGKRTPCRAFTVFRLPQNDDFSHHSQLIVQHAFVLVNAGLGEGHAEARHAQRGLWQTDTILRRLGDKSGVYDVRGRGDEGVTGAISIHRDVGRGRNL